MTRNQMYGVLATLAGCVASLVALSATRSETPAQFKQRLEHLKTVCADDIKSYCKDVSPGEGRIAACLDSRLDQLDTDCRLTWQDAKADISLKLDQFELAFEKNCGADVDKFCSDIPTGRGRIIDCLDRHEDALSRSCKNLQARIAEQLNKYLG